MNAPPLPDADLALAAQKVYAAYLAASGTTPFDDAVVERYLQAEGLTADSCLITSVRHRVAARWTDAEILQQITLTYGRPLFRDEVTITRVKEFLISNGLNSSVKEVRRWFHTVEFRRTDDWNALASEIAELFRASQLTNLGGGSKALLVKALAERNLQFTAAKLKLLAFTIRECLSAKVNQQPTKASPGTALSLSGRLQKYVRLLRTSYTSDITLEKTRSLLVNHGENCTDVVVRRIYRAALAEFATDAARCVHALEKINSEKLLLEEVKELFVAAGFNANDPIIRSSFIKLQLRSTIKKNERRVRHPIKLNAKADQEGIQALKDATKLNSSGAFALVLRTMAYLTALPTFNLDAAFQHVFNATDDTVRMWSHCLSPFDLSELREIARLRHLDDLDRGLADRHDITLHPKPDLEFLPVLQERYGKVRSKTLCLSLRVLLFAASAPGINIVELLTRAAGLSDREFDTCKKLLQEQLKESGPQHLLKIKPKKIKET